ncbi:MAG TPA: acetate/propionate family kinase [Kofleriaceae bacterium]|nr:acetate/propionate family kinase [Kofleriaceae bacterium]
MKVLVLNVGSTSVKFDLYDMASEDRLAHGMVERTSATGEDVAAALGELLGGLGDRLDGLAAVGHRVVHGGERLTRPVAIDRAVEAVIAECAVFAPLHNPANLLGIQAARARFPGVPQIAVFDTAFHATMPEHAFVYGLPHELYLQQGVRRYGFHGPSHQYMAACAAEELRTDLSRLRLVTCHLGGGASVAAIEGGKSIDTSMGMTPLEGLMMSTRTGDLDPAIPLLLARRGHTLDELDELFNRRSGLAGVSGIGPDFREIAAAAARGDMRARLAIDMFVHRIRKYIGAYAAELGGADAIVFTGGIGEGSAQVRERVCASLGFMGVAIDPAKNAAARPVDSGGIADISEHRARTRVLVVHTEEERMIAREVVRCLAGPTAAVHGARARPIPVGVSVRHVHLSRAACDALFGPGYELTRRRDVSQPGQYVTRETIDLIGPRGELHGVGIINPLRAETQVELSRTDAIHLGVDPPLRQSGMLDGTPGLRMRGPRGELAIPQGVIVAQRHVHMSPDDARRFGVASGDVIQVQAGGDRKATFGDIVVRVGPSFALDLHLDTDEANGAGLDETSVVAFAGVERRAPRTA